MMKMMMKIDEDKFTKVIENVKEFNKTKSISLATDTMELLNEVLEEDEKI